MKVVEFSEVREEMVKNFRRDSILPIIGSGFTRNCNSFKGRVPSGEDYRQYMIGKISEVCPFSDDDKKSLLKESFSNISSIYHKVVDRKQQECYLRNNFTRVSIEENKKDFLSLPWPYIYTLNIDDGIEKNSTYTHIVYANREINKNVFDNEKCVVKLHGDVSEMLTYSDSESEIFTQEQYIISLKKNDSLLSKLKHDSIYQNLLFVGCSLDDEIDLLASLVPLEMKENQTSRYICLTHSPSLVDKFKFEKYGITHCVVFDSFDSIYKEIYESAVEAKKVSNDDLEL